jgi:hypothetical protein
LEQLFEGVAGLDCKNAWFSSITCNRYSCVSLSIRKVVFGSCRLKEQLLREQRDHAEAISDVERVSVQEKERLKKEIQTRVEETKREMMKSMGEQLHSVLIIPQQYSLVLY